MTAVQKARFQGAAVLPGFLTSGFLFALLGALLPRWGYHLRPDYRTIGGYFICLAAGVIVPTESAAGLIRRTSISNQMAAGCGLASASLVLLAFIPLDARVVWRMVGLVLVGFSAGLINTALFAALSAAYTRDVARAVSLGGILFGGGCLASALLVAMTFDWASVSAALVLLALVPGTFAFVYYRINIPAISTAGQPSLTHAIRDFRNFGTVAFAALLFFQFGNEWAIAGWLPMFLLDEVGNVSPKASVLFLALYWAALLVGRVVVFTILRRVKHGWLLLISASAAAFGCVLLFFTNNLFGATMSILLIGFGYAAVYPLVAEKIGRRFTYYHPGLFNGIFTLALAGGMLAPGTLGLFAEHIGIRVVVGLPLIGTLMVVALILMIWLESKVTGR